jgi:FkbM family methyltransferase
MAGWKRKVARTTVLALAGAEDCAVTRRPPLSWAVRWAGNHIAPWLARSAFRDGVHHVNGVKMMIPRPPHWGGGGEFYMALGTYEHHEINWIITRLLPGDGFIDVGAHIGYFTLPAAKVVGRSGCVIAIEPNEDSFRLLVKNLELNETGNVHPFNVAASDRRSQLRLVQPFGVAMWSQVRHDIRELDSNSFTVQSETVDDIVLSIGSPKIKGIKIDVEGHEMEVLNGCINTLEKNPDAFVIFEVSGADHIGRSRSLETVKVLSRLGYRFFLPRSTPRPISIKEIAERLHRSRWQEHLLNLVAMRG